MKLDLREFHVKLDSRDFFCEARIMCYRRTFSSFVSNFEEINKYTKSNKTDLNNSVKKVIDKIHTVMGLIIMSYCYV